MTTEAASDQDTERYRRLYAAFARLGGGVGVELRLTDKWGSYMTVRRRGRPARITMSRATVDAGGDALDGTLAHEMAHLHDPLLHKERVRCVSVWLALLLLGGLALVLPAKVPSMTALWLATCIPLVLSLVYSARISHRGEFRADRAAARLLGRTEPVLVMIDGVAERYATCSTPNRLMSRLTHPHPARRRSAIEQLAPA